MQVGYDVAARKRAVNLTLNEDLVNRAKGMTTNLSAVVESLLADFLLKEEKRRAAQERELQATLATWKRFAEKNGSFADEHSTL